MMIGDPFDLPLIDRILYELSWPESRSLTLRQLSAMCGVPRREVEAACQEIALTGRYPLVADNRGVRLTSDTDELAAYIASLRHRLVTQYRRIRALRGVERRLRGYQQMEMFG